MRTKASRSGFEEETGSHGLSWLLTLVLIRIGSEGKTKGTWTLTILMTSSVGTWITGSAGFIDDISKD